MPARDKPARHSDRHAAKPYPTSVRLSAIAAAKEGLAAGRSLTSLAREMDLRPDTIKRWLVNDRGALRPVEIAAPTRSGQPAPGLILETGGGHRVEGLDLAGVVAVLRALEARR